MEGKGARLTLGRIVDADEVYVNGQQVGQTTYQYRNAATPCLQAC